MTLQFDGLMSGLAGRWKKATLHPGHTEIPVARPTPSLLGKWFADESIIALMAGTSGFWARPGEVDEFVRREVAEASELYQDRGWIEDPSSFHPKPPQLREPRMKQVDGWWRYEQMSFRSEYEPFEGDPGRERWMGYRANRTAHAWVLRHGDPTRPWVLAIHGYGMGHAVADLGGMWAEHLHKDLGLNVVSYVMPLHGPRRSGSLMATELFSGGIANLIHGEAQAMWDLRRIVGWIRRQGGERIGVHGLSLGGYTTALLSSLVDDLSCVVAGIPATDFIDLFRHHMPPDYGPVPSKLGAFWGAARRILRVVSPLAMPPRVPVEGRFIFAGLVDRLVPPVVARSLWEHWDKPQILWYEGSHVSFIMESEVRDFLDTSFSSRGVSADPVA